MYCLKIIGEGKGLIKNLLRGDLYNVTLLIKNLTNPLISQSSVDYIVK